MAEVSMHQLEQFEKRMAEGKAKEAKEAEELAAVEAEKKRQAYLHRTGRTELVP